MCMLARINKKWEITFIRNHVKTQIWWINWQSLTVSIKIHARSAPPLCWWPLLCCHRKRLSAFMSSREQAVLAYCHDTSTCLPEQARWGPGHRTEKKGNREPCPSDSVASRVYTHTRTPTHRHLPELSVTDKLLVNTDITPSLVLESFMGMSGKQGSVCKLAVLQSKCFVMTTLAKHRT